MKCYLSLLLVFVLSLSALGQDGKTVPEAPPRRAQVALQPCEVPAAEPGSKQKVLCGTYEVFENRAARAGRKIALRIVVFPATERKKAPDPLFYIAGGPGSSAVEDAPFVVQEFSKIRGRRDFVFVDQRGTVGSNPLDCVFFDAADPQSYLGHWNPPEEVRRCRAQLEARADLRLYTTEIAMADLDEVRAAFGYERINLVGGSYGTRAVQHYVKRYGKNVRTVILVGVAPSNQLMPRDFPQHTERALQGVLDECAADESCRAAFPNLRAEAKAVLERLRRGPVEVEVKFPPGSPSTRRVRLSRDLAGEAVRYMLYSPAFASRIPLYLHLAAEGNYTPLAEAALRFRRQIVASSGSGLYLSITCAEDLPWIKPGEGERNGEDTFLGDYRLRQQREACAVWPRGEIPKDYAEPTRSDVPALIVSGEWDPVTPPVYGEAATKNFAGSLHVVVPSGGHGFNGLDGIDCLSSLVTEFVDRGTAKGLDPSCVKNIRRKGFVLKLEP